jgi:hypothetical protein
MGPRFESLLTQIFRQSEEHSTVACVVQKETQSKPYDPPREGERVARMDALVGIMVQHLCLDKLPELTTRDPARHVYWQAERIHRRTRPECISRVALRYF